MARINKYAADATPDKNDKLIGTDSSGGTRNYSLENIGAFLAQTNVMGAHDVIPYKYSHENLTRGNIKDNNSSTPVVAFPTTNPSIRVSIYPNNRDRSSLDTLNSFLNKEVVISQIQDQNIFAVYRIIGIQQEGSTEFYNLTLKHLNSNNNDDGYGFITGVYYNVTLYAGAQNFFELPFATSDLSLVNGQYELEINHNLGKLPTISVKLSTGDVAIVPHSHINKNKLKVFFSALNSGTVYAN